MQVRHAERRKVRRQFADQPDVLALAAEHGRHQAADDHADQHRRPAWLEPHEHDQTRQSQGRDAGHVQVGVGQLRDQVAPGMQERFPRGDVHAEIVPELAGGDQHRSAGGETDDHRVRDEVDQRTHARQPERQLVHACEEGERQRHLDKLGAAGLGEL